MEFLRAERATLYIGKQPVLLRGMGLGGWLLPEGYMWKFYTDCDRPRRMEALLRKLCGREYADFFWERYYRLYITEEDIAWIAGQGLNSVRLPINARHLFKINPDGTVLFQNEMLKHVDNCIGWCRRYGLYVILDMHAAPGGQTGQNIDDSEADSPELFTNPSLRDALENMWCLLAERYAAEPAVGGYDLLNEPLPEWNRTLYPMLLPLYRRLISAIRRIDPRHLIILEGVHWATDLQIFNDFTRQEAQNQILLEFHKYWSNPDEESLVHFQEAGARLEAPLWMGEGGENNLEWYTAVFPMLERCKIGWCFWTYKKMEAKNSPATFRKPEGWEKIIAFIKGGERPKQQESIDIMNDFLQSLSEPLYHEDVMNAILRRPPLTLPAAAYDEEHISFRKQKTVLFRANSNACLQFADGHTGEPDWRRYGGETQPESQKIRLHLHQGDSASYLVRSKHPERLKVQIISEGNGALKILNTPIQGQIDFPLNPYEDRLVKLTCTAGSIFVDAVNIREEA